MPKSHENITPTHVFFRAKSYRFKICAIVFEHNNIYLKYTLYFHNFKFKNELQNIIKIISSSGILTCNNACTHEKYPILRVYANQCMIYCDFFVYRDISLFMELFLKDKDLLSFMCQSFLNIASLLFKPYQ